MRTQVLTLLTEPKALCGLVLFNFCFGVATAFEAVVLLGRGVSQGPLGTPVEGKQRPSVVSSATAPPSAS